MARALSACGQFITDRMNMAGQLQIVFSVVVATRNRPHALRTLLDSIQAQTLRPHEIIIVDDGSVPPLQPIENTVCLRHEVSRGACIARNRGFQKASGKYVFVFDDDAELVDRSVLERAVTLAERLPKIGAIGFRQLDAKGKVHYMQPASGESLRCAPSFFSYGAMLSKEAFDTAGGFFEPLGYYFEENELSLKLIDKGFQVIYDPSLTVVHHENPAGRDQRVIQRLCWRNIMYTIVVRYPTATMPLALLVSTLRWVRLATSSKFFYWEDLTWGVGSLMRNWPALISSRQPVRFRTLRHLRRCRVEALAPISN